VSIAFSKLLAKSKTRTFLLLVALPLLVLAYSIWVAPYRIEVTEHRLELDVKRPLSILQLSDLHSKVFGRRERNVIDIVRTAKPDLIVVTGDSVTRSRTCASAMQTIDALSAPLGVWVVPGNWEYRMEPVQGEACLCPSTKAHCLRNRAAKLTDDLWILGFDDILTAHDQIATALQEVPASAELIVIAHEPIATMQINRRALIFAGHTHGGQICLPFWGALHVPVGSGPYESGWYHEHERRMYVSRGIGTSLVPIRFWCGPEIPVFYVAPRKR
jgi:predicted MPP superfamily phosphohydrolase